jgi:hypothetical protein
VANNGEQTQVQNAPYPMAIARRPATPPGPIAPQPTRQRPGRQAPGSAVTAQPDPPLPRCAPTTLVRLPPTPWPRPGIPRHRPVVGLRRQASAGRGLFANRVIAVARLPPRRHTCDRTHQTNRKPRPAEYLGGRCWPGAGPRGTRYAVPLV